MFSGDIQNVKLIAYQLPSCKIGSCVLRIASLHWTVLSGTFMRYQNPHPKSEVLQADLQAASSENSASLCANTGSTVVL